jgi:hypothetical protein
MTADRNTGSANIILGISLALSGLWVWYLVESLSSTSGGMMLPPSVYRVIVGAILYVPALALAIGGAGQAIKDADRSGRLLAVSTTILIFLAFVALVAPWIVMAVFHFKGR